MSETSEIQPTRSLEKKTQSVVVQTCNPLRTLHAIEHDSRSRGGVASPFFYCTDWPCCPVRRLHRALPASHRMWTLSNAIHHGTAANELKAAFEAALLPRGPSVKNQNPSLPCDRSYSAAGRPFHFRTSVPPTSCKLDIEQKRSTGLWLPPLCSIGRLQRRAMVQLESPCNSHGFSEQL